MKARVALLLLVLMLLLSGEAACLVWMSEDLEVCIRDQEHGTLLASLPVKAGDHLVFEWIHSYEHIPWIEEYTITEDLTFRLDSIRVAGFGAGIPSHKGETTIENGMVVMRNINETFLLCLDPLTDRFDFDNDRGQTLIEGRDIPHHEAVTMTLEGKRRPWTKSPQQLESRARIETTRDSRAV